MPLVSFDALPPDARVWIFGSSRQLTDAEQASLLEEVDVWLSQWKAHGAPLTCGRTLLDAQFLAIGVDQHAAGASGCSIDALYRTLGQLERTLQATLVAGGRVFWRGADGRVRSGTRQDFTGAAARGEVTPTTRVFDTTVSDVGQLARSFERRAAESWHAQLLPV